MWDNFNIHLPVVLELDCYSVYLKFQNEFSYQLIQDNGQRFLYISFLKIKMVLTLAKVPSVGLARAFHGVRKQIEDVYVVSCARTPLGSMGGKLKVLILRTEN